MPVSPDFKSFILEQLSALTPVTARSMFGGVGLYAHGLFFGLVDDDTLFFKVDDETRPRYVAAGSGPFSPGDMGVMNGYYEVPVDLIEDPDALCPWLDAAVNVARLARAKKAGVKPSGSTPRKGKAR